MTEAPRRRRQSRTLRVLELQLKLSVSTSKFRKRGTRRRWRLKAVDMFCLRDQESFHSSLPVVVVIVVLMEHDPYSRNRTMNLALDGAENGFLDLQGERMRREEGERICTGGLRAGRRHLDADTTTTTATSVAAARPAESSGNLIHREKGG